MKATTFTPTESVSFVALAKSLAKRAAELLLSERLTIVLCIAAIIASFMFNVGTPYPVRCAAIVMTWGVQFAAVMAKGIYEEGGEL